MSFPVGQVSQFLRRTERGYSHWCPGCEEMHVIFDNWTFNGNVECPTFSPSVKITGKQTVKVNGEWTGEFVCGPDGKALDECCHYFLTAGQLNFCPDCTHALNGKSVPLPELPIFMRDTPKGESDMDYLAIAQALLAIIQNAPTVISEAETIYAEVKSALAATDQAAIDQALADAKASDAAATAQADAALSATQP